MMVKILDLEKTISLFSSQAAKKEEIGLGALKNLSEAQQVEYLFGVLPGSLFNIFVWPLDRI